MTLAVVRSRAIDGIDAPVVLVEVHLANGLHSFTLVAACAAAFHKSGPQPHCEQVQLECALPIDRVGINQPGTTA